jgi:hypothetical protein
MLIRINVKDRGGWHVRDRESFILNSRRDIMRITTLAVSAAVIVGVATPSVAAAKKTSWTPTFATCEALAMNRGITINERRSTESGPSAFRQFMVGCLAGQVEGRPVVAARVAPAAQIPGKWDSCEQLALQRGDSVSERRSTESGPSPYRQFMKSCLAGKV